MVRRLINIRNVFGNRAKDPLSKYYAQTSLGDRTLIGRREPGYGPRFGNLADDRLYVGNVRDFADQQIRSNIPHIIWNAGGPASPEGDHPPADFFDFESFVWSAFAELHSGNPEEVQRELGRSYASNNPYVYANEDSTLSSLSGELVEQVVANASAIIEGVVTEGSGINEYLGSITINQDHTNNLSPHLFLSFLGGGGNGKELSDLIFDQTFERNRGKGISTPAERRVYTDSFPELTSTEAMMRDLIGRIRLIQDMSEEDFNRLKAQDNTSIQYSTRATLIRFYLYMMSVAIIKTMPVDRQYLIQDALLSPETNSVSTYNHLNLTFETPYVTTKNTNSYLTDRDSGIYQGGYEARIGSHYNNYYPRYELGVSSSQISEELNYANALPNAYVRNIFTNTDSTVPVLQMEKYDTIITLDKRISNNFARCQGRLVADYYNAYGSVVSNQVDGIRRFSRVDASQLGSMTKNIIIPSSEADMFSEVKRNRFTNPMFTQVGFTREPVGEVGRQMWANNISSPILSAILSSNQGNNDGTRSRRVKEIITTYVATSGSDAGSQLESSVVTMDGVRGLELPITVYDPALLIRNAANSEISDSLILMENKPLDTPGGPVQKDEPYSGALTRAQRQRCLNLLSDLERTAESNSEFAYNSILDDNNYITPSEVLAYGISKRDSNDENTARNIQDIMIGNSPESQANPLVTSYIDTQIMYGQEYQYSLFEYRVVYGTKYKLAAIAPLLDLTMVKNILPIATREVAEQTLNWLVYNSGLALNAELKFELYVDEEPDVAIYKVPVYQKDFYRHVMITAPFNSDNPEGIFYPTAKVLDRPPAPPEVNFFPLVGNANQFAININPQIGSYLGKNALEVVSIGDEAVNLGELFEYQSQFTNYDLAPGTLEFANESIQDVKDITIYRTTNINFDVGSYNELYKSFSPENNNKVVVRKYSTDIGLLDQTMSDVQYVKSYDILDNLSPNIDYFYTVVVHDRHGNVSNPSQIYRIKLVLDKGLIVPEIDKVEPRKISTKSATKDLTKFIKIEASNLQSFPTIQQNGEQFVGIRSLASSLGKSVENETMIVRLTSKDTGKKFDIKINFIVKVDGEIVGG